MPSSMVRDYSYPVRGNRPLTSGKLYMGVEFEWALRGGRDDTSDVLSRIQAPLIDAASQKLNMSTSPIVWKADSSISTATDYRIGVELVTVPLEPKEIYLLFEDFFTPEITQQIHINYSMGTHVHLSKDALTPEQICLMRALFASGLEFNCSRRNNTVYSSYIQLIHFIGGRGFNMYSHEVNNPLVTDSGEVGYDRYDCLSPSNDNPTLEARFAKSFSSIYDFLVLVEFLEALVTFTNKANQFFSLEYLKSLANRNAHTNSVYLQKALEILFEIVDTEFTFSKFINHLNRTTDLVAFKLKGFNL